MMKTDDCINGLRSRLSGEGTVCVAVRVRPGAPRSRITGVLADGSIKIDIAVAPEQGKANRELADFLGGSLGVSAAHVEILSGHTGRRKMVRITAYNRAEDTIFRSGGAAL